jgi:threonine/homoserine/homoserine lactone efflux protein
MYPAAEGQWWTVTLVATVFALCTITTMLAVVALGYLGLSRLAFGRLERYSHALAGLTLVACGLAIQLGL